MRAPPPVRSTSLFRSAEIIADARAFLAGQRVLGAGFGVYSARDQGCVLARWCLSRRPQFLGQTGDERNDWKFGISSTPLRCSLIAGNGMTSGANGPLELNSGGAMPLKEASVLTLPGLWSHRLHDANAR